MKKFKTIKEQKRYLIENKNIIEEDIIEKILSERSYASIINPYKKFFYTSVEGVNHKYDKEVSIVDYYKLATYDDLIAKELHYMIGIFERRVKGAFAHVISFKMRGSGDDYATSYVDVFSNLDDNIEQLISLGFNDYKLMYNRKYNEFYPASDQTKKYRISLLEDIANIDDNKKKRNNLFKKYIDNDKPIPFWLVVHTLSLGDLLSIYQMMGKELKQNVLDYLNEGLSEKVNYDDIFKFEDDLNMIKELRNVVNHYEPLFEFILSKPVNKTKFAINRIMLFSNRTMKYDFSNLHEQLPVFNNEGQKAVVDLYCEIINKIKKRDE